MTVNRPKFNKHQIEKIVRSIEVSIDSFSCRQQYFMNTGLLSSINLFNLWKSSVPELIFDDLKYLDSDLHEFVKEINMKYEKENNLKSWEELCKETFPKDIKKYITDFFKTIQK